jgi:hypothetical protein
MTSTLKHEPLATSRTLHASARDLVTRLVIQLSPAALALLDGEVAPPAYFARLLRENHVRDARHFLAHALPARRALWWSCLCAHDVCDQRQVGLEAAIAAVVRYVRVPSETHRRAAEDIYRSHRPDSLAAMLAGAAYASAGGLGPRELATPIAAPAFVTPRLVSTVVYLAATVKNLQQYQLAMRDYIQIGEQIAQGQNLWPDDETPTVFTRIDVGGPLHALAGPHPRATHGEHHAGCTHGYCEEVSG